MHRVDLSTVDRLEVNGIPRTSVARTLLDCAAVTTYEELCGVVDTTLCVGASHPTVVLAAIERAQAGPGKKGVGRLRRALEAWTPGITPGSPAEMRLLRQITQWGLPEPERQIEIRDTDDRCASCWKPCSSVRSPESLGPRVEARASPVFRSVIG